ncbi:MAG: polysaccharide biosynthesis tyrosine autokinase [Muribaculaceae bacterium]|nr:polysaccharide biosynthesis tyrosine autokinase [Muribaculaceae bacterium]
MEESKSYSKASETDTLTLKEYLRQCSRKWLWFLLSFLFFCGLGAAYILRIQPQYKRSMEILVKDDDSKNPMGDIAGAFSAFGLGGGRSNVYNEVIALSSPAVMYEVVDRLDLDMNYIEKGLFHGTTLFGENLPFTALMTDIPAESSAGFRVECFPNGDVRLFKFYKTDEEGGHKYDGEVRAKIDGKAIRTPIGRVVLSQNPEYKGNAKKSKNSKIIYVGHTGMTDAVDYYGGKLHVDLADTDADVIELSIKDTSVERAVAILTTVIDVYNQNWMDDKNRIAVATSDFIDDRLKIIERELGVVDNDISKYKSEHLVPDLKEAAKLNMEQDAQLTNKMLDLTNEIAMTGFVKDYVTNPANRNSVIPVNTGMGSPQLETQIASYNDLLLTRNNLVHSSSETNPIVLDYDAQLRGMREAIVKGVSSYVTALQSSLNNLRGAKGNTESQLSSGPTQAKYLLSVERQQKVKESLYLFLLQKREENELTQTFTAYNTRILTPPMGSTHPVSPKKNMIMGVMFFLSLVVPALWLYFRLYLDDKVRSRRDLERMVTPFAGEIPMGERRNRKGLRSGRAGKVSKSGKSLENVVVAVKEGSRDAVSESFRIVRGNIDFMVKNQPTNVIMLTSFNPGSGKSFIAFNLAASFALKGKRVLIIDGDLRHGSTSQFVGMPSKGLSEYLTGSTDDWRSTVKEVEDHAGVFVLPIGHRPPNPSELLDNGRIGELLKESRADYYYVFIDCPPVDIVVDTQIIEKYVDRTLFIVRAGVLDKKSIVEIDAIYKDKRFKSMSVILNGTDSEHSRSHSYGSYGYYGGE